MGQVLVLVIVPHSRDPPDVFREDHMDAPVCRTCGQKHWSRLCEGFGADKPVTKAVTEPVTKPVTVTNPVTEVIDWKQAATKLTSDCLTLTAEVMRLTAEVAHLKRQLSEANGGKVPMTSAERVRKHRAKGKL
jgi:hypothetical protein